MLREPLYSHSGLLKAKVYFEGRGWQKIKAAIRHPKEVAFVITGLLVMIFTFPVRAAESDTSADNSSFEIRSWTTEDGLPENKISCLKQTRDGYLWIGTRFGLSRFDGFRFANFDESNTPEMANESIDALAEDSDNTLWIGTPAGLLSYRDNHFERVFITGQTNQGIRRLSPAPGGGLWICTVDFSVVRLFKGHFSCVWQAMPRSGDEVISFAEGKDGWLNIFTRSRWLTISPDGTEIRTNALRETEALWTAALPGKVPGQAWIGTREGIFGIGQHDPEPFPEDLSGSNSLDLIFQDRTGNLWANVQSEFFGWWDGTCWQKIDVSDEIEKGAAICMEQDFEGSIWIATEGGLVRLRTPMAVAYTKRDGLAHNKVWSVCQGTDGAIWVGTEQGLSRINETGEVTTVAPIDHPGGASDRCLWPDPKGGVWTARNRDGLFDYDNGKLSQVVSPYWLGGAITALGETRSGVLYVCTEKRVLAFPKDAPPPWTQPTNQWEIPGVRSMLEARDGAVWLGTTGNGVVRILDRTVSYFTHTNGFSDRQVWAIYEDNQNGALWLGTDKGLTRYQKGEFFAFTRQHGLLEERVNCILADDDGYLWLSGLKGIYRVELSDLNDVADGRSTSVEPFALGTADGPKRAETNGEKQPAGWKARDGRLWFPTVCGVVVIDPKKFPRHETPPTVLIEQFKVDNKALPFVFGAAHSQTQSASSLSSAPDTQRGSLNYQIAAGHGHVVEFQYTANSLVDSRRVKFKYRLSPTYPDWREETTERSASYINLHPGNYVFEVKASNHHNVWNPKPTSFAFSIAPYFWQTRSFYALSGATVLAIAAGIQAYRLRWQHRLLKLEQQRALAAERARIARDLHDDLGTALTGLALELDVIGRDPKPEFPVVHRLDQTAERTRALAERMREVVWSVNPRCDTVPSLASFLEQQISQFLRADGIKIELDFPEDIPGRPIGGEARHQLALGVREALTNVIRHAQATEVVLSLSIEQNWLVVQVKDNGRGLQPAAKNGNGLHNMRDRLQSIGGTFDFTTEPGSGTTIIFRVPLIKTKSEESI